MSGPPQTEIGRRGDIKMSKSENGFNNASVMRRRWIHLIQRRNFLMCFVHYTEELAGFGSFWQVMACFGTLFRAARGMALLVLGS